MCTKIPCTCQQISPWDPLVNVSFSVLFPHSCDICNFIINANLWYHHFLLFPFRRVLDSLEVESFLSGIYFRYHLSSSIIGTTGNGEISLGEMNTIMKVMFSIYEYGLFLPLCRYSLLLLIKIFLVCILQFPLFSPVLPPECFEGKDTAMFLQNLGNNQTQTWPISHPALLPLLMMPVKVRSHHPVSHLSLWCLRRL